MKARHTGHAQLGTPARLRVSGLYSVVAAVHGLLQGPCCIRHSCAQALYGSVPRIRTPRIVWAHTARRVLTMEWVDGVKLTDKVAMAAAGLDVVDFVDVGIECTLRQLLEHGYFHADPQCGLHSYA